MGVDVSSFTPVEETALLSLYARALDSRWPRPILGDHFADELAGQIDYDFEGLGLISSVVCQAALRANMLDDMVRQFIDTNSHAVVVDLGAGLDDGMLRVEPPPTVEWYSVDFPAVIAVRDRLFPSIAQAQSIGASLTDEHWPEQIPADRPTMLIADGLLAFLDERQIITLFSKLTDYFQSGQLAFNDGGHQGWPTRLAVKLAPQKLFKDVSALKGKLRRPPDLPAVRCACAGDQSKRISRALGPRAGHMRSGSSMPMRGSVRSTLAPGK
ncbi:MAG: class I SAM-dependent methyltransferase [Mycobacterium sp.]